MTKKKERRIDMTITMFAMYSQILYMSAYIKGFGDAIKEKKKSA